MPDVLVVESPAKAKTINKYLGSDFTVLASFGHVRDLPPKDGSVRPDEDFAMDWQSDERGQKQVRAIASALRGARRLYLATDPDREGEAISWHVQDMLARAGALKGVQVSRVTFNEITKKAVQYAVAHPRELDLPLIEAYLARRALDYLVGFSLSPVLWRKLPGSRSAGRVQSVALRLICEREAEIEVFKSREYWTVEGRFTTPIGAPFPARLTHHEGKRLDQFDLNTGALAEAARKAVEAGTFSVGSVEKKRSRRNPPAPFTTSTLQQEASRKLGLGAQATMRLAQQLYEGVEIAGDTVGLITYMRTDGVQMSRDAISAIRDHVKGEFGPDYLPAAPREYATKAKNAQEAHEAVRPTDVGLRPQDAAQYISGQQLRLYELVWKRAVASQMQSAELDQTVVELVEPTGRTKLRANGSVIAFDGFLKLYREDADDSEADRRAGLPGAVAAPGGEEDDTRTLPPMREKDVAQTRDVSTTQHFTQPPPRFSEASLVKRMEELGIGRPSTYASILQVLQDREYVTLDKRRFTPSDRGRLVTAFLVSFFERYVSSGFTSGMEEQLDDISGGRAEWRAVMRAFWDDFSKAIDATKELKVSDVIDRLDDDLGPHFFPAADDGKDPRVCPACSAGRLGLRLGKTGAFIGCSNYPECRYTRPLAVPGAEGDGGGGFADGVRNLGAHPVGGQDITMRRGPYGIYVQLGEPGTDEKGKPTKPRRASLLRDMDPEGITLERAVALLSMPRIVGVHPEKAEEIVAHLGRFGPYITMGALSKTLDKDDDVLSLGLNRAVTLLADAKPRGLIVGLHPKDGEKVEVRRGRFGPYLMHGKRVANLPRGTEMEAVTLDEAVTILAEKGKELPPLKGAKGKPKPKPVRTGEKVTAAPAMAKPAARKPAAKKPVAKKPAAKKKPAKKSVAKA